MRYSSLGERVSVGVKAHVLYSRLLSDDDYWSLLSSDNVAEIAEKLQHTAYADSLSTLPADPHRTDIEGAIKTSLISQVESVLIHLSNPRDNFFHCWVSFFEADNLKSIFRHIAAHRTDRDELRRRLYDIHATKISYDNVLSARDFSELADSLRGTPYYKVLSDPLKKLSSGEELSIFPLEMALDTFVEVSLYKALLKLDKIEMNRLLPLFGNKIDLYNIYILYRAIEFYSMTPEETLNRLLPIRYKVKLPFLRELVRMESVEQVVEALQNNYPVLSKVLVGTLKSEIPELTLERNIRRFTYLQAQKIFGEGSPSFHTIVSYFLIREHEIEDIVRIIEDVRYGYDRRQAAAYLVRPILSGGESEEWQ